MPTRERMGAHHENHAPPAPPPSHLKKTKWVSMMRAVGALERVDDFIKPLFVRLFEPLPGTVPPGQGQRCS